MSVFIITGQGKMRAAISKGTFVAACNSDSTASPSSSSSSSFSSAPSTRLQLLPSPCTPPVAFHYGTTSPTRCVATFMFEVPLDRPCSNCHVEGNLLLEPLNHFFPTTPSFQHTTYQGNQGTRHKRNGKRRFRAQLLSLQQGLSKNGDFWNVIGATGLPMARSGQLQGPGGVCMALVLALVTLLAAVKQGLFVGSNQHQEICLMCNGLKFQRCGLCKGRGIVEWEGKLRHTDPCPRCFGSCRMKCSKCGGL